MTPKRLAILCNTAPPGERPQYEQMEWDYDNEPDALTFYDPTDVENLIDEVEALRADALRYRWLREQNYYPRLADLDAAIDAAQEKP